MKWIFTLLIAILLFTACSTVKLTVNDFTANPTEVEKGGKTTLTWNLEGEGNFEVYITNTTDNSVLFDKLPMKGSREIILNSTTTFELKAKSKKVSGGKSVTVKVK